MINLMTYSHVHISVIAISQVEVEVRSCLTIEFFLDIGNTYRGNAGNSGYMLCSDHLGNLTYSTYIELGQRGLYLSLSGRRY